MSPDFGPGVGEVFGPSHRDGGPELVQLLTPEGERVEHPDFSFDLDDESIRGFYYPQASAMLIIMLVTVSLLDLLSQQLRKLFL